MVRAALSCYFANQILMGEMLYPIRPILSLITTECYCSILSYFRRFLFCSLGYPVCSVLKCVGSSCVMVWMPSASSWEVYSA